MRASVGFYRFAHSVHVGNTRLFENRRVFLFRSELNPMPSLVYDGNRQKVFGTRRIQHDDAVVVIAVSAELLAQILKFDFVAQIRQGFQRFAPAVRFVQRFQNIAQQPLFIGGGFCRRRGECVLQSLPRLLRLFPARIFFHGLFHKLFDRIGQFYRPPFCFKAAATVFG